MNSSNRSSVNKPQHQIEHMSDREPPERTVPAVHLADAGRGHMATLEATSTYVIFCDTMSGPMVKTQISEARREQSCDLAR